MHKSGDIERDTQESNQYLSYFPALLAAVVVALGAVFYVQQDRDLHEREDAEASRAALMSLRLNIERRLEQNIYVVDSIAELISRRDLAEISTENIEGRSLLALSSDFGEVAIVRNGIIENRYSREQLDILEVGLSFQSWRDENIVRNTPPPQRSTRLRSTPLQKDGRKFMLSETPITEDERNLVVSLIDIDEIIIQSGIFDNEHHTFTIQDVASGAYIFGTPFIDMSSATSETLIIGDLRWILYSTRTGHAAYQGGLGGAATYLIITILALLIIGPITWACHLLRIKHQSQLADRKREKQLQELSTRLGIALTASRIGISEVDAITRRVTWDERSGELFGLLRNEDGAKLRTWWKKIHPKDRARAIKDFRSVINGNQRVESEFRVRLADRTERHVRSIWSATQTANGLRLLNAQWDVTSDNKKTEELIHAHRVAVTRNKDLLRAKDQLEYMALHDPMTGLPNRRYFDEYVADLAPQATSGKRAIGILQIDLDSFKQVNDSNGHAAGDKVLAHAARAIDRCTREDDFVARTGGDEFVLFCWRDANGREHINGELARLAKRIISAVQQPMILKGKIYKPAVSIGVAPILDTKSSWESLLANADTALYQAKDIGRNRHAFHDEKHTGGDIGIIRGSDDIVSGLDTNQFIPAYQPQFRASDQRLIGIEALARWHHPIRGILTPETFMPSAKHLKLEAEIDAQIMEHTLRDIERWNELGLTVPRIAVNISPRRLCSDTLIDELKKIQVPEGALSFELLESIFVGEDDAQLISNVDRIKELGIDIEIDDFGTGFASIVSLLRLEPNRLKIDRSLVAPVLESPANRQVLRSIVEMARALDIQVLAEGVENPLQARVLRSIGCDALQGFGLGKPMPMAQMTRFLERAQELPKAAALEM